MKYLNCNFSARGSDKDTQPHAMHRLEGDTGDVSIENQVTVWQAKLANSLAALRWRGTLSLTLTLGHAEEATCNGYRSN